MASSPHLLKSIEKWELEKVLLSLLYLTFQYSKDLLPSTSDMAEELLNRIVERNECNLLRSPKDLNQSLVHEICQNGGELDDESLLILF